jgi:hypothetical protein
LGRQQADGRGVQGMIRDVMLAEHPADHPPEIIVVATFAIQDGRTPDRRGLAEGLDEYVLKSFEPGLHLDPRRPARRTTYE